MNLHDLRLSREDFGTFGQGLSRPECVWIDHDGVWASDARGGVALVRDGEDPRVIGQGIAEPNGYSRRPDGSFVIAGLADGGLHLIEPNGDASLLCDAIDGQPLGTVNCAFADGLDRIWVSVMTRDLPWHAALSNHAKDGYILRVDEQGRRCEIVADGLDLTNEVKLSPDGKYLYAAESLGARLIRFPVQADGSLGARETVGPDSFGRGCLPDGFAFDPFGNIWVTIISQNGLLVIDKAGDTHVVYSDANVDAVEQFARVVEERNGTVEVLAACASPDGPLRLPTSLAFGGPDGRTGYIGSLLLPHLATFRLPDTLG